MTDKTKQSKALLEQLHQWPCRYTFKFVVPAAGMAKLSRFFAGHKVSRRQSRTGKYVSLTVEAEMASSDEVLALYAAAGTIEGVIAL
ncbi:MAG: DUF493 domain-containing protein [Gammaproteobacteria bacterium]|nr:DUF493 domain-containing protein [Gammaproteobacteria bacterium]